MNKTQLYIQLPETNIESLRFSDTYLALGPFGTVLGLEFPIDVTGDFNVGDTIFIDKDNKSINPWADGPATILGITFSTIYPAPASLVYTDRPLQSPISFTSGESGTIYLGSSIQSNWTEVDLSDNVPFPITFNIADVRDINNRNGAYSKTISIPGTKNNNDVFKYIFDIQGVDNYDTRVRVKCNIVVDTIPVLEGYIQLNSIKAQDNKYWTYECTVFGENANFSKEIDQNARLEDLDFSEFDHDFNILSATSSWIEDWNYGYYYPYIDYNMGQKPNFKKFNQIDNLRASIYAKQYWDKIFNSYSYTYESEFLNSEAFENLIIPPTKSIIENDPDWRFFSTFRAGLTQSITYNLSFGYQRATNPTLSGPSTPSYLNILVTSLPVNLSTTLQLNDTIAPNGDPGLNFIQVPAGEFYYKNVYQNNYNKLQNLVLNLDFKITATFSNGVPLTFGQLEGSRFILGCQVYINDVSVGQEGRFTICQYGKTSDIEEVSNTPTTDIGNSNLYTSLFGEPEGDWDPASFERQRRQVSLKFGPDQLNNLGPNDEVKFKLFIYHFRSPNSQNSASVLDQQVRYLNTGFSIEFYPTTDGTDGTYFFNSIDSKLIDNQPFKMSEVVPRNIKQIDFINSIINMFNLYLYQDKIDPKKIFIEPRDRFYETSQYLDWSNKLDIDKEIVQTPIVERYKRVLMTYKSDKDFYNTQYTEQTKEIYGQFEYLTGDEFSTSEKKIELIFSPTTLNMYQINNTQYDNTHIYSRIYDPKQPITDETRGKVERNIRILYRKTLTNDTENFYIRTLSGFFQFNVFPYAGHLDDPTDASLDLSFQEPRFLFYENNFTYTDNNLYNEYYRQFFEEVYGPESKVITAYIYLNSQDILDFDYRKLIYIDNISSGSPGYFRINKVEYDPFNKQSYKVELIKVLNNFKSKYKKIISIGDVGVALPGTGDSLVSPGNNTNTGGNSVIGGFDNFSEALSSGVFGQYNLVKGESNILSGSCNITQGRNNAVIGGRYNNVSSTDSGIFTGASNSVSGNRSAIIGGYDNISNNYSSNSLIIGGYSNRIGATSSTQSSSVLNSFILGGCNNTIFTGETSSNTDNSFIIGGFGNIISPGLTNSTIINGHNFTATQSNTIYLEGNVFVNGNDISGGSTPTPIPTGEVVFGNGTGITSDPDFIFKQSNNSLIVGPNTNTINVTSAVSSIISSGASTINQSSGTSIISSYTSTIGTLGLFSTIQSSHSSLISEGQRNSIIGSNNSYISVLSNDSVILGGQNTGITNGSNLTIASGQNNNINTSSRSAIIGGSYNSLINSQRSIILGGTNLSLTSTNDTVLVPNLKVNDVIRLANSSGTANINPGTTITINNTLVTAFSRIFVSAQAQIGVGDTFYVNNIVPGVSFDITHTNAGGFSTIVAWLIINP